MEPWALNRGSGGHGRTWTRPPCPLASRTRRCHALTHDTYAVSAFALLGPFPGPSCQIRAHRNAKSKLLSSAAARPAGAALSLSTQDFIGQISRRGGRNVARGEGKIDWCSQLGHVLTAGNPISQWFGDTDRLETKGRKSPFCWPAGSVYRVMAEGPFPYRAWSCPQPPGGFATHPAPLVPRTLAMRDKPQPGQSPFFIKGYQAVHSPHPVWSSGS